MVLRYSGQNFQAINLITKAIELVLKEELEKKIKKGKSKSFLKLKMSLFTILLPFDIFIT